MFRFHHSVPRARVFAKDFIDFFKISEGLGHFPTSCFAGQNTEVGTRFLCLLSTPYPHRKAVFVARSFDFGRKKRLQPPCAAISCFPYCEVSPLLFRLPLSPLLLRLQSVCLYRSYRPAVRQVAAARWISPRCCSERKIDLPI